MTLYRDPKPFKFTKDNPVELHFHDHDETWYIMGGKGRATMVDRSGQRSEFMLGENDIWMVEAGVEHGCEPLPEISIFPVPGTIPKGSHTPGHYYMKQEKYMPTLTVVKTRCSRYD